MSTLEDYNPAVAMPRKEHLAAPLRRRLVFGDREQICPGCGERFCPDISANMDGSLCATCEEKLMDADTAWEAKG